MTWDDLIHPSLISTSHALPVDSKAGPICDEEEISPGLRELLRRLQYNYYDIPGDFPGPTPLQRMIKEQNWENLQTHELAERLGLIPKDDDDRGEEEQEEADVR